MRSLKLISSFLVILMGLTSCTRDPEKREYQIMADMSFHYALEAQEALDGDSVSVMRMPVEGTIPRGFEPYLPQDIDEAASLVNPLEGSIEVLNTGRKFFNINCVPCHGKFGAGDGNVITKATYDDRMPKPPELFSSKLVGWEDGRIFHIIAKGQGNMPSYADRMDADTRWAVVHYVRAIQQAKHGKVSAE